MLFLCLRFSFHQMNSRNTFLIHFDNFDEKEDISLEKNIFYHNGVLVNQPRRNAVGLIKLSGIKKSCNPCCKNVKSHLKLHMVPHLQCKFCSYQLRTLVDKNFWDKVRNICGKICSDALGLKYRHKKVHNSDWVCDDCDIKLNQTVSGVKWSTILPLFIVRFFFENLSIHYA